jgi:alpha-glucosidase
MARAEPRWSLGNRVGRGAVLALAFGVAAVQARGEAVAERLGPSVVRYHASEAARAAAEPSVSLAAPIAGAPIGLAGLDPVPVFGETPDGWRVWVGVEAGTSLYGTGMVTGPLERTGRRVELYTLDAFAYGDQSVRLYQAHPWVMGVRADGSAFGVIFDSTWRGEIDTTDPLGQGIVFSTVGPAPPVIVIDGADPGEVVRGLAALTGNPVLMPRWAQGFHQSRYQYTPQSQVVDIAQGFRIREIPADVMHIDVEYMDGYRVFTFDPATFPDPAGLDAALDAMGFRTVWNVSPTIKVEAGNGLYEFGRDNNLFVKLAGGVADFIGQGFPGDSVWVDFTNAGARAWFAAQYASMVVIGADGVWTDLNEPSVFEVPPTYDMPADNAHAADAALGGPGPHLRYRNIYGMQTARTAYEGLSQARPDARPFVLTRSNFLGGQRYAAMWTGDNVSGWYHLGLTIPMTLTLGLSGQPYSGPDIGGFALAATPELYARWIGIGALMPFARGHSLLEESEPWTYGGDVEYTARLAIARRYRLMPYFDTVFFEAHATGMPVARPVFFANPADPALRTIEDAFLLGDAIVVAAAVNPEGVPQAPPIGETLRRFGLPISADDASDLDTDRADLPHLYLRPGRIVPLGPLVQSTGERPLDELTLIVSLDGSGNAVGTLFEDAGDGWGVYTGDFLSSAYSAVREGDIVRVRRDGTIGNRAPIARPVHVRLLCDDGVERRSTGIDGQDVLIDITEAPAHAMPEAAAIDGRHIPDGFASPVPLAITAAGGAPGIEGLIGALHAESDADGMRIGITGAMRYDNAALVVLLDTTPGGPISLPPVLGDGPAVLGGLAGTVFDAAFTPEHALVIDTTGGGLWTTIVGFNADGSVGASSFPGRGVAGEGTGALRSGANPDGVRIALDNGAMAGSPPPGWPARDPATIGTEIEIPWAALGIADPPQGGVRIAAFALQRDAPRIDSMVPDTGIETVPIAPGPDFGAIAGDQFVAVPVAPPAPCAGDLNADGATNAADFTILAGTFGSSVPPSAPADLNADGVVNAADFVILAGDFGCPTP